MIKSKNKKRDNFFIDFHNECIKNGELPDEGICYSLEKKEICYSLKKFHYYKKLFVELFEPSEKEKKILTKDGLDRGYWGYDKVKRLSKRKRYFDLSKRKRYFEYTPLRQNMILFCDQILNS